MNCNDYVKNAMRTNDNLSTNRLSDKLLSCSKMENPDDGFGKPNLVPNPMDLGGILNACLGLSGEVGELNDLMKKWIFHEKDLDIEHAKKELGDVMWYVALLCDSFGWKLGEILETNIDKLKARYPQGFDTILANNRKVGDI